MSLTTPRTLLCLWWAAVSSLPLLAQQSNPTLDALKKRHVITAESAQQVLVFDHLIPNETYGLLVPGGEPCLAQCMPEISVLTPNTQVLSYNPTTHLLKFVANAALHLSDRRFVICG